MTVTSPSVRLPRFYPIVPDAGWLARIVPLGVKLVQLRIKDGARAEVLSETRRSLAICAEHGCQLVLNDYWDVAIEAGADFIHLGQEDLAGADLAAIRARKIRFGVSTHDDGELETALTAGSDYIALGPIYETKLKRMPWAPQGLGKVATWKARIEAVPLVAIGGLTPERAPAVAAAGADSLAVITDFITTAEPDARIREWLAWAGN